MSVKSKILAAFRKDYSDKIVGLPIDTVTGHRMARVAVCPYHDTLYVFVAQWPQGRYRS